MLSKQRFWLVQLLKNICSPKYDYFLASTNEVNIGKKSSTLDTLFISKHGLKTTDSTALSPFNEQLMLTVNSDYVCQLKRMLTKVITQRFHVNWNLISVSWAWKNYSIVMSFIVPYTCWSAEYNIITVSPLQSHWVFNLHSMKHLIYN